MYATVRMTMKPALWIQLRMWTEDHFQACRLDLQNAAAEDIEKMQLYIRQASPHMFCTRLRTARDWHSHRPCYRQQQQHRNGSQAPNCTCNRVVRCSLPPSTPTDAKARAAEQGQGQGQTRWYTALMDWWVCRRRIAFGSITKPISREYF